MSDVFRIEVPETGILVAALEAWRRWSDRVQRDTGS